MGVGVVAAGGGGYFVGGGVGAGFGFTVSLLVIGMYVWWAKTRPSKQ